VQPAQRFVLLGTDGAWRHGMAGQAAIEALSASLSQMDARRAEIGAMLADEARLAMLPAERVVGLARERDAKAHEGAALGELARLVAVKAHGKSPQYHFSLLLVRLLQPKDKAVPFVLRALRAKEEGARGAGPIVDASEVVAPGAAGAEERVPAAACVEAHGAEPPEVAVEGLAAAGVAPTVPPAEEEEEEEMDEEEREALAQREKRRRKEAAREAEERAAAVDYF